MFLVLDSLFVELFDVREDLAGFDLCTPVVCTGGAIFDKPPNRSVKPPSAVKLVNAFNAPGFDNNCAKGIADANELDDNADASDDADCVCELPPLEFVDEFPLSLLPPLLPLLVPLFPPSELFPSRFKFAFCSSMLWDKRKDRKIFLLG